MLPIVTERGAQLPLSARCDRAHRRRPADAQERERAAVRLGLRRRARPRPRVGGPRRAGGGRARRQAAAGLFACRGRDSSSTSSARRRGSTYVVPLTLAVIFVLLYLAFRRIDEALLIMLAVPFALDRRLLAAVAAGLRDVGGHGRRLHRARRRRRGVRRRDAALPASTRGRRGSRAASRPRRATLLAAIEEGAVLRVRPKAMTVAVIMAGLLPIMLSEGTGCGGHAADRRADGRRDDHRAAAVDARHSSGVSASAP